MTEWKTVWMEADIGTICVSGEGEQGGTRRVPPLPTPPSPPPLRAWIFKEISRGQEGGPQAKLPGACCGILKITIHPRLRAYLALAPTLFHSKVDPGMKLRTGSRTKCLVSIYILQSTKKYSTFFRKILFLYPLYHSTLIR